MNLIPVIAHNWLLLILVLLIAVFIFGKLFRFVIKYALAVLFIAAAAAFLLGLSGGQMKSAGKTALTSLHSAYTRLILNTLQKEMKDARCITHPDGTYDIQTKSVEIQGLAGGEQAKVTFQGHSFTVNVKPYSRWIRQMLSTSSESQSSPAG